MSNTTLPVFALRNLIVSTVHNNPVTIITAETGAGKSTQVPQYLLEEGFDLVVTQPRRLAARTVAARVAQEFGTPFGDVVGFRTAYERQCSDATRCLFVTDGLALVSELMGGGRGTVLVIDEVHEWNLNIEVLVAWAKFQIGLGVSFKVVLMSATMEAERLSEYFDNAPIIDVPGRTFPVEEMAPAYRMEDDVVSLLRQGRNVLAFQPGKSEIEAMIGYLKGFADLNAEILPLYGELTADEQAKCFAPYGRPKCVVATNVAQTSVTIPDIDAVVDSGMERRVELVEGIEGLYLRPISHADAAQRKGRAGRTKPGLYVDHCPEDDRLAFPLAEILRVRLDQAVLRLAESGIDMEVLRFFHQPDLTEIHEAKRALVALGCMEESGRVTPIGRRVAKMPVSVKYARMVVEAARLGVVDDVVTVAAILEQGGITARVCPKHRKYGEKNCTCWRQMAPGNDISDALAQLQVYKACGDMKPDDMRENGVFVKAYFQAKEKRGHLAKALKGSVAFGSTGKLDDILRAVCAGMVDHLYHGQGRNFQNADGNRELARESVVTSNWGTTTWVIGEPFDLEIPVRGGTRTLYLLRMATRVSVAWLTEVAPQLVSTRTGTNPRYDMDQDEVVSTTETWFNGQCISSNVVLDPSHVNAPELRRSGRNERQWRCWADKPAIALPDPADDDSVIPEMVVYAYGDDAETSAPLLAYGVVTSWGRRSYSSDPWFKILWTRNRTEAEQGREGAIERMETARFEAKDEIERKRRAAEAQRLMVEAEPLRTQLVELWNKYGYYNRVPQDLCDRLYRAMQLPRGLDQATFQQWTELGRALIAEVPQALETAEAERRRLLERLEELRVTARSHRDRITELLDTHEEDLTEDLLNRLEQMETSGRYLPDGEVGLNNWVTRASELIADVEQYLHKLAETGGAVSNDDILALAARYNKR